MTGTMSKIRLVLVVPEETRRHLRLGAATLDVDMSELAQVILEAALSKITAGKTPADITAALKKLKDKSDSPDPAD
jgi:glycosyltransferase A (GT-A) superfamily protein (DUF2064 family)